MSSELKFGVIGQKIGYSKSADIFKAALETIGQLGSCDLISIEREKLTETINSIRNGSYIGCSITIPYKNDVIPLLDKLDRQAEMIGAVNSVCMKAGELTGYNTDAFGFAYPLKEQQAMIRSAMVLGCGGSAKAVVYSLSEILGCEKIFVIGRSSEKLKSFTSQLKQAGLKAEISFATYDQTQPSGFDRVDLVANCTPLGGWNAADQNPLPGWFDWTATACYYDLNYNSGNKLVKAASAASVKTYMGDRMLVAQALRSLELWTGHKIDFEPVYTSVFAEEESDGS